MTSHHLQCDISLPLPTVWCIPKYNETAHHLWCDVSLHMIWCLTTYSVTSPSHNGTHNDVETDLHFCVTWSAFANFQFRLFWFRRVFLFHFYALHRTVFNRHVLWRLKLCVEISDKVLVEPSECRQNNVWCVNQPYSCNLELYLIVRGRRFHGPVRSISDTMKKRCRKPVYFLYLGNTFLSLGLLLGCCQAHSN